MSGCSVRVAPDFLADDTVLELTLAAPAPIGSLSFSATLGTMRPETFGSETLQQAAEVAARAQRWAEAKRFWGLAVQRMTVRNAGILNQAAWALVDTLPEAERDPRQALIWAEEAVALTQAQDGAILDTLAVSLFQCGRLAEAAEKAAAAAALVPDHEDVVGRARTYAEAAAAQPGAGKVP
jgi:tetratricopeptide (TPR) repeat protein